MDTPRYTVIVAEDEELLLFNLIDKIHNAGLGFEVIEKAQTGEQAWELIKNRQPDLVITDIKMPVMDGMALLEKIQQRFPTVKTIITSGFSDFEFAKQALKLQVSEYLLKPVDKDELYSALLHVKTQLDLELEFYSNIFTDATAHNTPEQIALILKEFIVHNYNHEINLNLIAGSMNYSSSYLTKIFLQQYECTPSKYIISLRIQKAQYLLSHCPHLSIKQIGELVGYQDQGYFSRIFKKQTEMSPFDYRELSSISTTSPE